MDKQIAEQRVKKAYNKRWLWVVVVVVVGGCGYGWWGGEQETMQKGAGVELKWNASLRVCWRTLTMPALTTNQIAWKNFCSRNLGRVVLIGHVRNETTAIHGTPCNTAVKLTRAQGK